MVIFPLNFFLNKLSSFIEREISLLLGAQRELNEIKLELASMIEFLMTVDQMTNWVGQVRDAAYDIEDVIDEFMYHLDSQRSGSVNAVKRGFDKTIRFLKIRTKHRLATKIQEINTHIQNIAGRNDRYIRFKDEQRTVRIPTDDDAQRLQQIEMAFLTGEDQLVGIDRDKELLLQWLRADDPRRTVVSVVGMGGSGKTTLVGSVYRCAESEFDCAARIIVGKNYVIEDIFKKMIKEFFQSDTVPPNLSTMEFRALVENLDNHLQQKRYFIVLDDLWSTQSWEQLRFALPNNAQRSRVVLTTRSSEIAGYPFGVVNHVHAINRLQTNDAWVLFCKVFLAETVSSWPQKLKDLALALVEKCEGLPLAIVAMSRLVASKHITEDKLNTIYKDLNWELSNNPLLEPVSRTLMLSFKDLPHHLKHCLLYCCVFPKDHLIPRKRLIRLWIAEGLVKGRDNMTLEEVAGTYLTDLTQSMLQVARRNDSGRVKRCQVHDVLRELALSISKLENFCEVYSDGQQNPEASMARHLSLHQSRKSIQISKKHRSFFAFCNLPSNTLPSGFRLLRILDLQDVRDIKSLPKELVNLFNLRYLNLRGTGVKELPRSLGKLWNLQFLDISGTMVDKLPGSSVKLSNLRYLKMFQYISQDIRTFDFVKGIRAPKNVCKLENLQSLHCIEAKDDMIRKVKNMTQLTKFGIANVRATHLKHLCSSLQGMNRLQFLFVKAKDMEVTLQLDTLTPLPPLHHLILVGKLGKFPSWFPALDNLVYLHLHWSLLHEDLSRIQALPELRRLVLVNAYARQKLHFGAGWFPSLKKLDLFDMPQLNKVVIDPTALSSLSQLSLIGCQKLRTVPQGIENLAHLQELYLKDVPEGLVHDLRGINRYHLNVGLLPQIDHFYQTSGLAYGN